SRLACGQMPVFAIMRYRRCAAGSEPLRDEIMSEIAKKVESVAPFLALFRLLPGPSRKRIQSCYGYRVLYRNPEEKATGCVLRWEVSGGRQAYQVALEREETGNLRLHCTCADAVYRAEAEGRCCKHVRRLLELDRAELAKP